MPTLTPEQATYVKSILLYFFPNDPQPTELTDELVDIASHALADAMAASKAMDYVPRPPGDRPGLIWLFSQIEQMAFRRACDHRIYEVVKNTVTLKYRSQFITAVLVAN